MTISINPLQPGTVPDTMFAQVVKQSRYGAPSQAYQIEEVAVPPIASDECLIAVMAAGINYNGVWAALGDPIDLIEYRKVDPKSPAHHIGGSDASGIVWAVGDSVDNVKIGDEVVAHCGWWPSDTADDQIMDRRARIWGFEINYGSFAQFAKIKASALLPKPPKLSWEEAASYMLTGATACRMLHGFPPNNVQEGDVVLIWGGAGGLGSMAIQVAKDSGGIPIAVVGSEIRGKYCLDIGAAGVINRNDYSHWGVLPDPQGKSKYAQWKNQAQKFKEEIWSITGEKLDPRIVIEHTNEKTLPTSCYVCDRGGMVVISGGTTGYNATLDIRNHWSHQKRLQGSHFANAEQCKQINSLVKHSRVSKLLSHTYEFDEIPTAHQLMYENRAPVGNSVARIGASDYFAT